MICWHCQHIMTIANVKGGNTDLLAGTKETYYECFHCGATYTMTVKITSMPTKSDFKKNTHT
jgi:hypothetical protein